MLDADINVTKQVEDARYRQDGTRESFIRYEFFVGKHGPFVLRIPKDGFDPFARDAALNAEAAKYRFT